MTAPELDICALHKRLGTLPALGGVDLAVAAGEIVALLGPNGAGKSTLLRCASGQLRPDHGRVLLAGQDPRRRQARRGLGLMPQQLALFDRLTARENLQVLAGLLGVPRRQRTGRVAEALARARLVERADQPVRMLSGGMQRRLNLAASLLHQPRLLLLDEPTAGVDAPSLDHIETVLRAECDNGTGILLVTHDLDLVERLSHRAVLMVAGRVALEGAPAALVSDEFAKLLDVSLTLPAEPRENLIVLLHGHGLAARQDRVFTGRCRGEQVDHLFEDLERLGVRPRELRVRDPSLTDLYQSVLARDAARCAAPFCAPCCSNCSATVARWCWPSCCPACSSPSSPRSSRPRPGVS
jgi:ABC-2 type transport system ATP-binding protein